MRGKPVGHMKSHVGPLDWAGLGTQALRDARY